MASNEIQYGVKLDTSDFQAGINQISKSLDEINKKMSGVSASSKSASNGMKNFSKALKGIHNPLKDMNSPIDTFIKKISRIGKMLKMMILRKALRGVIESVGDGFKGLAKYSSEFDKSMSLLSNSSKQLGYSFSAMVAPLINALAPALNTIIQLCIKAVNAINQLFSAFAGKSTFITAKTQTDDWAKSLDKAGSSAKKAQKTIMGFDEINKLNDDKDNSGGGSSIDPSKMFETKDINPNIKKLKDMILDAWKNADFTELGAILGQKLKDALERIPWDRIKEVARKIGKSIATFINGFVEVDGLGTTIGNTLAEAFNTAFEFLYSFVTNLHWKSVGQFIADTINGFFEKADFKKAGKTLSEAVKGVFDLLITTISGIDWVQIGEKVYQFVSAIDWSGIANRIGQFVGKAFSGLGKLVFGYIKKPFQESLEEFNQTLSDKGVLGASLWIIKKISDIFTLGWFRENIAIPLIKGIWDAIKPEWNDFWNNDIKPLFDKNNWKFEGVKSGFKETFQDAVDSVKKIWNGLVSKINGTHSIFGKSFTISLPRMYATGGFPEDGLFMANHGELVGKFSNGRTAVANNEQITQGIAQAVYSAIMSANASTSGGSYINNTIQIDGETIARAVTKGQNSINRRYSPTMA